GVGQLAGQGAEAEIVFRQGVRGCDPPAAIERDERRHDFIPVLAVEFQDIIRWTAEARSAPGERNRSVLKGRRRALRRHLDNYCNAASAAALTSATSTIHSDRGRSASCKKPPRTSVSGRTRQSRGR